jgi:hypothetical protein
MRLVRHAVEMPFPSGMDGHEHQPMHQKAMRDVRFGVSAGAQERRWNQGASAQPGTAARSGIAD